MSRGPKIFYYCYDHNRPTGGEKHSYQHVDILNENGFRAFAFHRRRGFRLTWFENDTPTVDQVEFARCYDQARDYLVFPEDMGRKMLEYSGRRIIFNKNVFHGFGALGHDPARCPYTDPRTVGVLCVSEHNYNLLRCAFPKTWVFRVYASIRSDIFTPPAPHEKKRVISLNAKNAPHSCAIMQSFTARSTIGLNEGAGFAWRFLNDFTEREIAGALRESMVFVFTSVDEGLPRMPLEAMACGCMLVAYRNGPLAEIAPSYLQWDYGDVAGLVGWLERIVSGAPTDCEPAVAEGIRIASAFSRERQTRSVCQAWTEIFERTGASLAAPGGL